MPQTPVTDYTKISSTVAGAQFAPAIAVLSGGGYVIVWQDSSSGSIYAQRFSASGQPVGNELHLDGTQGGSPVWVSVAATANDGFVIAFQAGSFAQAEIFGHRYDSANNSVGGLFAVNSTGPNEQFNPHIVTLDGGAVLFTWDTRFTSGSDDVFQEVRGRIYLLDGQAFGADFPIAPMSAMLEHGISAIAPLPGGGFVVTWQSGALNGDAFDIVGQRFTSSGAPAGAQFQVNADSANSLYGNDVARLSDGGFVVSWVDAPGSNGSGRIVARHYGADGNPVGGEILVDSKASGAYGRTVVTALANGAYVVSWTEADAANNNVLARAFGSNDVPLDPAFEMAFDSPFGANFFSDGAVTLPNGNVVFAWDGPSVGTGTGQDVYMRMYNFSGTGTGPINGTPGPDALVGTSDDDVINGLADNDTLDGMGADDTLIGGLGGDVLVGGGGIDTASYEDNWGAVFVDLLRGGGFGNAAQGDTYTGIENLRGSIFNDYFIGSDGVNRLEGGDGNDTLLGALGADELVGGGGSDTANYEDNQGAVIANLTAGRGYGNAAEGDLYTGIENLTGTAFNDAFYGDAGANILAGRRGNDILVGGGGPDVFVFDTALEGAINVDSILDFVAVDDTIQLSQAVFAGLSLGMLSENAFVTGADAADTADRIIYNSATGQLLYDADGNGAAAAQLFATLSTGLTLTASDFVVVV